VSGILAATLGGGPLLVSISPANIFASVPNGTETIGTLQAVVYGGNLPYSYSWTLSNNFVMSLSTPTASSTYVVSTGTNVERTVIATLTVTDSAGGQQSATAEINVIHGTAP